MLAFYYEMFHEIFEQIEWGDFAGYFNWIGTLSKGGTMTLGLVKSMRRI